MRCHPEVTSDQTKSNAHVVFPDQNYRVWDLDRAHNGMIRGHFGLGMVWSESLRSGDRMIRGHFGLGIVWSEVTSVWAWHDQRSLQDGNGLIRGGFKRTLVWSETISSGFFFDFLFCFTERCSLCQEARKSSILITDTSRIWCLWSEAKGSSW